MSLRLGKEGRVLVNCHAGCSPEAVVAALGLAMADLFDDTPRLERQLVSVYDYRDEAGVLLYQVCRYKPKDFRARRPVGSGWEWNLQGVRRVPYRLPELLAADRAAVVLIVEGEKDVDRLRDIGFVATTNDGGAGKWRPEFREYLHGRPVVVVPDNDPAGASAAAVIARSVAGSAESVGVLELPGLAPKGDVSDWLDKGGTAQELAGLIEAGTLAVSEDAAPEDVAVERPPDDRRSQAAQLVDLADGAELFHTPADEPFATLEVGDHRETHPVRSQAFRGWLRRRYWHEYRKPAGASAMADAIETLAARANFDGERLEVSIRVASSDDRIYVDLANAAWQAVEIDRDGWRITNAPPVKFRRPSSMAALPEPRRGGSIELLRPFVNVGGDDAWHLFAGYLVAAFRAVGPYLVLLLYGEQGSAKSTTTKIVRLLIDPSQSPLRSEPREQQDLLIAARNNWVVAFDNISHLPPWLSDTVCRLASGGGLGKRQLYTDQDEIVLDAQRPQILNGISEFATRGDLLDRAIIAEQPTIANTARRSEAEFWQDFEMVRPTVLGALCDAVSTALRNEAGVVLTELPRMADPTRWVTAAEPALSWPVGTFAAAYKRNRNEGSALALDAALIAAPLFELADRGEWQGSAAKLLSDLAAIAGAEVATQRDWPRNARALSEALKRLAPDLRTRGIAWDRLERTGNHRPHRIRRVAGTTVTTVTTVTPNTERHDGRDGHDGPIPGSVNRVVVSPPTRSLLAAALDIFGDDVEDFFVQGTA